MLILTATIQRCPSTPRCLPPGRAWVERLQARDASLARILTALLAALLALAALASTLIVPMLQIALETGVLPAS